MIIFVQQKSNYVVDLHTSGVSFYNRLELKISIAMLENIQFGLNKRAFPLCVLHVRVFMMSVCLTFIKYYQPADKVNGSAKLTTPLEVFGTF